MYRVIWLKDALENLADIWVHADSNTRKSITAATHSLDNNLQTDPLLQGESRSGNDRVVFAGPIGS